MKGPQLTVFNYSIKNQGASSVDIFIDGDIVDASTQAIMKEYFGDDTSTSYKSFRDLLNKIDAAEYNVYINSGGGQITEAMAIHDLLIEMQNNGKVVNTIGRGIIASSATYILMAGKSPSMSSNSWLMIHNVTGFTYGDVNQIENYASTMRKFNDAANGFYQNFTGLSKTVITNMMDSETWMTADEAKSKGFVKNISGEVKFSNAIKPEQWQFNNSAVLNSYNSFTQKNNPTMDTTKITDAITNGFNSLMEKLGITNKKEDEAVKNAFGEFSKSITDAIGNIKVDPAMTSEEITNLVNTAVTNSFKTLPENFVQAIKDANKDFITNKDLDEKIKNNLSKEDFTKEMGELKSEIINKIGGAADAEKTDVKNKKKGDFKNRYAYENLWDSNDN